jgi:hypothetical protein
MAGLLRSRPVRLAALLALTGFMFFVGYGGQAVRQSPTPTHFFELTPTGPFTDSLSRTFSRATD